jgi:colanic acid/amylovoran biosynthesis glycosyltransferase
MIRRPIAMILSSHPLRAESFLRREVAALERNGQPLMLVMMDGPWFSAAFFRALWRKPRVMLRLLWWIASLTILHPPLFFKSLAIVPMSCEWAERLRAAGIAHVHAHFATHAATLAVIVSELTGIPYSFTAHAHAIFVDRALLRRKVAGAVFVRTISEFNRRFLETLYPEEARGKVHVVRIGYAPHAGPLAPARGEGPVVYIGSLKPHKGLFVLLEAMEHLEGVRCEIVGEGPLFHSLLRGIRDNGLEDRIRIRHPSQTRDALRTAAVVVQPSVVAPDGQMDGIPISLIDAMAAGKPVVASAISGIPELVGDGESGLLVDPANPRMLAAAIERVLTDSVLRARISSRAKEKAGRLHDPDLCAQELIALFDGRDPAVEFPLPVAQ